MIGICIANSDRSIQFIWHLHQPGYECSADPKRPDEEGMRLLETDRRGGIPELNSTPRFTLTIRRLLPSQSSVLFHHRQDFGAQLATLVR
jgi:hypothetical protein